MGGGKKEAIPKVQLLFFFTAWACNGDSGIGVLGLCYKF